MWRIAHIVVRRIAAISAMLAVVLTAGLLVCAHLSGFRVLRVATDSMQPIYAPNDIVIIRRPRAEIRVGQVVSYASRLQGGELLTHRVQSVDPGRQVVVTKGDNASRPDWPIRQNQIRGVVRWHISGLGRWLLWLQQPIGLVAIVYLPALLVIVAEFIVLGRELHGEKAYRRMVH